MYAVDGNDQVEALKDFPLPSGGAPMPLVLADDDGLVLAYLVAPLGKDVAIVEFDRVFAHYFGMPNEEAISGHPLFKRGLRGIDMYEVKRKCGGVFTSERPLPPM